MNCMSCTLLYNFLISLHSALTTTIIIRSVGNWNKGGRVTNLWKVPKFSVQKIWVLNPGMMTQVPVLMCHFVAEFILTIH